MKRFAWVENTAGKPQFIGSYAAARAYYMKHRLRGLRLCYAHTAKERAVVLREQQARKAEAAPQ